MKITSILALLSCLFVFLSCKNGQKNTDEKILKIECTTVADSGMFKYYITADTIRTFGLEGKDIATKNSPQQWEALLKTFRLEDFKKRKQGREHIMYDAPDYTVTIVTNKGEYSVRNGYEDKENYAKIKALDSALSATFNQLP